MNEGSMDEHIRLFSDQNKPILSTDFQSESMIHKLKKIKKKKMANYKDIEKLENIHDVSAESAESMTPVVEGFLFNDPSNFGASEYTGDDVEDEKKMISPNRWLILFIEYIYTKKNEVEYFLSRTITEALSMGDFKEADVMIFKDYIGWFLSIVISTWAVFNWYYLMFFNDRKTKSDIFLQYFRDISKNKYVYPVGQFLEIVIELINYTENVLFIRTGEFIGRYINKNVLFLLVFNMLVYAYYYFSEFMKILMIDLLSVNLKSKQVGIIYGITTLLIIIKLTELTFDHFKKWYFAALSTIFGVLILLFANIMYSIIVLWITPIILGFFLFLLFFVYSIFGIWLKEQRFDIRDVIEQIWKELDPTIKDETFCKPLTLWEKIMNFVLMGVSFIREFYYIPAFIYMFVSSSYSYPTVLKSEILPFVLIGVNVLLSITIIIWSIFNYFQNTKKDAGGGKPNTAAAVPSAAAQSVPSAVPSAAAQSAVPSNLASLVPSAAEAPSNLSSLIPSLVPSNLASLVPIKMK